MAQSGPRHASAKRLQLPNIWPTLATGALSSHEDLLINVEAFRGAIREGNWKLVKIALLPGKTELFDLSKAPGEKNNVADQFLRLLQTWKRG